MEKVNLGCHLDLETNEGLVVHQLNGSRGEKKLFRGLTFSVELSGCLQVKGPNGCGKSSLLKMLVGLLPISSGKICWLGKEVCPSNTSHLAYLNNIFYLGHKTGINQRLTPLENLCFWFSLQNRRWDRDNAKDDVMNDRVSKFMCGRNEKISEALNAFDLNEYKDTPCDQLSAGFYQRVALARLCFSAATLWILDEPFTALDKEGIKVFCNLLNEHLINKGCAIIVSHTALPNAMFDNSISHQVISLEESFA